MRSIEISRNDYCQFLTISPKNYSLTYFAEQAQKYSHDVVNRFLQKDKYSPALLWEHIKPDIIFSANGYVIFDDTILTKRNTKKIEIARSQYSGSIGKVTTGIGVVSLVYYNPDIEQYWVIDYRIYQPDQDGKSKIDHLLDMLNNAIYNKEIPFSTVLFDTWYATHKVMAHIDSLNKIYYAPLKTNRNVTKVGSGKKYQHVSSLTMNDEEKKNGTLIHVKVFPQNMDVTLFQFTISTNRVDYIVTNDKFQKTAQTVQDAYSMRWVIESMHREIKQLTGIEKCQCRKQRIQRNHIACAFLVWAFLKRTARKTKDTIYRVKNSLLDDYVKSQLRSPTLVFQSLDATIA
ncbi:MAG: transposase [Sulfurovum sp.]|nr:transposase [Sulfurovum sp.]